MKDSNSPVQSKSDFLVRNKTGSEPLHRPDRFIPSRNDHHLRSLAVDFMRAASSSISSFTDPVDYDDFDLAFERSLLTFKLPAKGPASSTLHPLSEESKSKEGSSFMHSNSSVYSLKSSNSNANKLQRLPKKPFRILDIPGLEDDYYTNLLDWSSKNDIAICLENKVYTHDYMTGATTELYEAFECETISSLGFNPEGDRLAFGNVLGQVYIFDIERQSEVAVFQSHTDRIGCLDWKDPGIVSGSRDRNAVFLDPREKSKKLNVLCTHAQEICGIRWNNELNLVATGGNDNKVGVWAFGEKKRVMSGRHASGVKALAWSQRQYGILASGGGTNDRFIKVWNTNTGEMDFEREVEAQVCSILYSKVTNDIISAQGGELNDVRVWRSNGLKPVGVMTGHEHRPLHLALSPDGTILATASPDEKMCFWKIFDDKRLGRHDPSRVRSESELTGDVNLLR